MTDTNTTKPATQDLPAQFTEAQIRQIESRMTLAELIELETVRKEGQRYRAETEVIRASTAKLQVERDEILRKQNTRSALRDCGVKWHDTDAAMTLVGDLEYDLENQPCTLDGVPLGKALQQLALEHEHLVDGRSLKALKERRTQEAPQSKSEFTSIAQKIRFVNEFGADAWERLPLKPSLNLGGKMPSTWTEYLSLPVSERARLAERHGDGFIGKLHNEHNRAKLGKN
jgi:hypothetical protein